MEITYGYRDTARSGRLLPVSVRIINEEDYDTDGFVIIDIPGDREGITYTYPVTISSGQTDVKCTITIPEDYRNKDRDVIRVRLIDIDGAELSRKDVSIQYRGFGNEAFTGILSDSPQDLAYLKNLSLGNSVRTHVVTLNQGSMPDSPEGLSQLDIIVISGYNMTRLSLSQQAALIDWVRHGGTLLLGTGGNENSLGLFAKELGVTGSLLGEETDTDMGMKYSDSGPDGAVIKLILSDVKAENSEALIESGDIDVVERISLGSGRIALIKFDLCSISKFCLEHPAYAEDLLATILGTTGLNSFYSQSRNVSLRNETVRDITNTYQGTASDIIMLIVIAAVWFLALGGGVLYLFLKNKGLNVYYSLGVLVLTVLATIVVWMLTSGTRIKENFIGFAQIINAEDMTHETFVDLRSPEGKPITLGVSADQSVEPVVTNGYVSVTSGISRMLAISNEKQFEENIFEISGTLTDVVNPVRAELYSESGKLRGTVTNVSGARLSNVLIVAHNRLVDIESLDIMQSVDIGEYETEYCPTHESSAIALITAGGSAQKRDILSYALETNAGAFFDNVKVFCFKENEIPEVLRTSSYKRTGHVLYISEGELSEEKTDGITENVILSEPQVISGSFDASTNTIPSGSQTVLEYRLGSTFFIDGMELMTLSKRFETDSIKTFTGQIAVYNYFEGSYDLMDSDKLSFSAPELEPYLSPTNNITIRFLSDDETGDNARLFLPVPVVSKRPSVMVRSIEGNPVEE
ncbi:MAG: hypothetical protein Q4B67_04545 [Eubacteriales bacterium]|nr:hypothetical protein [Eubacteriales bacterium]